ncbi:MAG: segregation/condensation protein A [Candidatus Kerfeldbacteria bacterium]|nr:segregation/condensation protein A [Candidatus Kerfeldbacteria bacterium]
MRHVTIDTFAGPLDLLLQLIEQEQLDISQVSLAKVTDQYIAELQKLEEVPVDELADFLVIAAKLLLIKSRLLVPGAPVDDDDLGLDLERQLKMYQAFVAAAKNVGRLFNKHQVLYPREGYANLEPIFNPPAELRANDLRELYGSVLKELEPITRLPQTVIVRTINIRQKISQIQSHLLEQKRTSFHRLLGQAKSTTEAIVTFLAVLELVKLRSVAVLQNDRYADMEISTLDDSPTDLAEVTTL